MVESLFLSAVTTLGGSLNAASHAAYADLEKRYQGRAYHNLAHLEAVLETYLFLSEDLTPTDGARVVLAICYHDVVYDPRAADNEVQSARLAQSSLDRLGIDAADRDEIAHLILVTRDHRADDPLGALIADADLAILQSAPDEYDRYAAAIRQEYAFVPDDAYRAGRTKVLQGLLDRERLFVSPLMDESTARANLEREIVGLTRDPGRGVHLPNP